MAIKFGDFHFDDAGTVDEAKAPRPAEFHGQLKSWVAERHFGFIARDDGERDVFVHRSALLGAWIVEPEVGMRLAFGIEMDRLDRPRATNIVIEPS